MKPIRLWYLIFGFIFLLPLFSCGSNAPYKMNSQFSQYSGDEESGIGGTGILANQSGIGGTGIIGEITGFGSIFVNGVEVEVEPETHLYIDGKKVMQHQFARGEIVALRIEKNTKSPVAREIHIRHEVIGAVEKVLPQTQQFIVLGQLINAELLSSLPTVGDFIQVSGFRDNLETIHARHISKSHNQQQNLLRGKLKKKNNQWYVGQQQVSIPSVSKVKAGELIRIQGVLKNAVLQAKKIQRLIRLPFSKPIKNILIQGFIYKNGAQKYTVSNYNFSIKLEKLELQQRSEGILYLKKSQLKQTWKLKQVLNKQRLPVGSTFPVSRQNRLQQPVRPMSSPPPFSMPGRHF